MSSYLSKSVGVVGLSLLLFLAASAPVEAQKKAPEKTWSPLVDGKQGISFELNFVKPNANGTYDKSLKILAGQKVNIWVTDLVDLDTWTITDGSGGVTTGTMADPKVQAIFSAKGKTVPEWSKKIDEIGLVTYDVPKTHKPGDTFQIDISVGDSRKLGDPRRDGMFSRGAIKFTVIANPPKIELVKVDVISPKDDGIILPVMNYTEGSSLATYRAVDPNNAKTDYTDLVVVEDIGMRKLKPANAFERFPDGVEILIDSSFVVGYNQKGILIGGNQFVDAHSIKDEKQNLLKPGNDSGTETIPQAFLVGGNAYKFEITGEFKRVFKKGLADYITVTYGVKVVP